MNKDLIEEIKVLINYPTNSTYRGLPLDKFLNEYASEEKKQLPFK
jgi:hypothetical protein